MLLVIAGLVIGWALKRGQQVSREGVRALNAFVIFVSLPALVVEKIHAMPTADFAPATWIAASMPWVSIAFAWVCASALRRFAGYSRETQGALTLVIGFGNTSFVGFPLLSALLGPRAIPPAVILDQLGSFLGLATAGNRVGLGLRRGAEGARGAFAGDCGEP